MTKPSLASTLAFFLSWCMAHVVLAVCWALQPRIHSLWVSEAETRPQLPAVLDGGLVL